MSVQGFNTAYYWYLSITAHYWYVGEPIDKARGDAAEVMITELRNPAIPSDAGKELDIRGWPKMTPLDGFRKEDVKFVVGDIVYIKLVGRSPAPAQVLTMRDSNAAQ